MRRVVLASLVSVGVALGVALPASAHVIVVQPPGHEAPVVEGWTGGPALPGKGKGLIPGGPTGSYLQSPSHAKGLVTSCEALRANGNGVVDIFGPPFGNCFHGGPPPGG
jgi:hypothetical protein